ncbi:MAG: FitA-like ribbon-helix-helix domain-containing protein [Terriglobales bacterium]
MPTLYVENVPADVYDALRERARERRTSIAAETIALLREHVPTSAELIRRRKLYEELMRLRESAPRPVGPPVSTVDLLHGARAERERQLDGVKREARRRRSPIHKPERKR